MVKKAMVILLTMLLVLVVGQGAFAKGYIQLDGGYYGNITSEHFKIYPPKLFVLGLSGKYDLTDKISLVGAFSFNSEVSLTTGTTGPTYEANLYTRFNVFNGKNVNVGLNLGLMYQGYSAELSQTLGTVNYKVNRWHNELYLIVGAYGEVYLSPKIKAYGEISMPIVSGEAYSSTRTDISSGLSSTSDYWAVRFLLSSNAYFTGKLGMKYEITPSVFVGLEYYIFRNFPTTASNRLNFNVGYSF